MATTDELLKSVLVMQTEILGRLAAIEREVGVDQSYAGDMRDNAIADLEYIADSDFGAAIWKDLQPTLRKIAAFEDH
ncbi:MULTISPECIES: hypothetical protein [Salinicola]|uniref:Uncharacterized protein n=1 Tax=Salinicola rhizosphaerae TaxID=1443141 RepID=A0ABQ3EH84_9GAMM|nr:MULTISPECIES: hypothetical protein [Salinicola]GHB30714.1 hypothetical protein GCM10009038_31890 [Salinicola rhizosphaerae]